MRPDKQRVCVIGAGPSGLTTLRALQTMDESQFNVVCLERYDDIGGIWNFRGREGIEEDGLEVHSGMYYNLISNGPKETVELPEHRFLINDPEVTGYPCFPDRPYILNYLRQFANKFDLLKHIRYNTWVQNVSFDEGSQKFRVQVKNLKTSAESQEIFDYVIVATGHFNFPNYVSYPGQSTFKGQVIHSKQFMDSSRYRGKRVLVVGSSYSAEDIAIQSWRSGATYVTISYRTKPLDATLPDGMDQRPLLTHIDQHTVSFSDGSKRDFDVIIYCTGYLHKFPFMDEKLRLETSNRLVIPLYKGVMLPENARVMYVGMQDQFYTFTMFWLQGHLCAHNIRGELEIPSVGEMKREIEKERQEEDQIADCFGQIDFQTRYVNELYELTKSNGVSRGVDSTKWFYRWEHDRSSDILTYKKQTHFSCIFE